MTGHGGLADGAYLIREAMRRTLDTAASSLSQERYASKEILLLDIGGRGRPYADLFASRLASPRASTPCHVRHLVIDPGAGADAIAMAETLPVKSACADVVLCTQVLEHVADPARSVSEMARALRPGGICLLTTHGTWFYHPDPEDYWRWTPAGLASLFGRAGFAQVDIAPVGGTGLAIAVLTLAAFERSVGEGIAGTLARRAIVAPANWLASRWLMRRVTGRACVAGELAINYLVTARR